MAHKCTECGKLVEDPTYVKEGCPDCGNKKFHLVMEKDSESSLNVLDSDEEQIDDSEYEQVNDREDIREHLEQFEGITVEDVGVYNLNLERLGRKDAVRIVSDGKGSFYIEMPQ